MYPKHFRFSTGLVIGAIWLGFAGSRLRGDGPTTGLARNDVYAFCFDTHDARKRNLGDQARMLKELGYDGAGHVGLEKVVERLSSLDAVGLRLYLAGVKIDLKRDLETELREVQEVLPHLKDRQVVLYTVLTGLPSGAAKGMQPAVRAVRRLSELAAEVNIQVGIYPHTGDWVATVPQAVDLAGQVGRDNCGVIFNLCHFLRNEPPPSLDESLERAAPLLVGVTINGADLAGRGDRDWRRLIQPLDEGSYDLRPLLRRLAAWGYRGPVGIMCYGIGGDAAEHLSRSRKQWRRWSSIIAEQP